MTDEQISTRAQREALAAAFDQTLDPLAEFATTFEETGIDPFALFRTDVLAARGITPRTQTDYDRVFSQWREHMVQENRHPACPSEEHVKRFITREYRDKDNHPNTITEKLRKLDDAYSYWQDDPSFPHPQEYNPFELAQSKVSLDAPPQKRPPQIQCAKLRATLNTITDIRDLSIIVLQLKLGLRATEVCNIALGEVNLQSRELRTHYPQLCRHPMIETRPNAVYIPHDRNGNKSGRPRSLPLDAELQQLLKQYLLIRPDVDNPWLFLSKKGHQLHKRDINRIWKEVFRPEYSETEQYRAVTSHYGRHYFTTYWRVEMDVSRPLIKYMRGDRPDAVSITERDGIDEYIHTYYEDIEPLYREHIYRLLS